MSEIESTPSAPATPDKKPSSWRFFVPVLGGIAAIAAVGFFASQAGLDKELLRQRVDAFAASVKASGEATGRDFTFTYKDITMQGGLADRYATIVAPQFSIGQEKDDETTSAPALLLRTESADLLPKAVDLSALQVRMAHPLVFANDSSPDKSLLTITPATPLVMDIAKESAPEGLPAGEGYLSLREVLPSSIDFTYLRERQAEGKEDATPSVVPVYETLTLTHAEGGSIALLEALADNDSGKLLVDLKDLALTVKDQKEAALAVKEINIDFTNAVEGNLRQSTQVKALIADITGDARFLPYAPIAIQLDAQYDAFAPQAQETETTQEPKAEEEKPRLSLKLKEFSFSTKESKLYATADFVASDKDLLPVGNANITITNLPYLITQLRSLGLVNIANEGMITAVLERATDQKFDAIKDLNLDISRVRDGAFMVGKTTFEELFAIILKESLKGLKKANIAVPSSVPSTQE